MFARGPAFESRRVPTIFGDFVPLFFFFLVWVGDGGCGVGREGGMTGRGAGVYYFFKFWV